MAVDEDQQVARERILLEGVPVRFGLIRPILAGDVVSANPWADEASIAARGRNARGWFQYRRAGGASGRPQHRAGAARGRGPRARYGPVLAPGCVVGVATRRDLVSILAALFGPEVDEPVPSRYPVKTLTVVLTKPEFAGRNLTT